MKKLWLLLLICLVSVSVQAELVNRYSFEGDMSDSVGDDGDGVLAGDASIVNGTLNLPGAGWAELPITVLDGMTSVTLEAWFTYGPADREWTRVFDIGKTNDGATDGHSYIMYTPSADIGDRGQEARFSMARQFNGGRQEQYSWGGRSSAFPPVDVLNHLVCVYENGVLTHYLNGVLDGTNTTEIALSDITVEHAKLGAGSFTNDPALMGSISEFRIYDSALSAEQATLAYQLGDSVYKEAVVKNMVPANKAADQLGIPVLSWETVDGVTATSYNVMIAETYEELEPNDTSATIDYTTVETSQVASGLAYETEYFWRVDSVVGGEVLVGPVYSFTTGAAEPKVLGITPEAQIFEVGDEITISVSAISAADGGQATLSYQWMLNEAPVGSDSNVLVITDAQAVNEGEYYCIVTDTDSLASANSAVSAAVIPALVAHWDFDGTVEDIAGDLDGTIVGDVTYAEGKVGVSAAYFNANYVADNNIARDGFIELPSMNLDLRAGTTFSVWANPSNAPSNWQRFFEFGSGAPMDNLSFLRFGGTNEFRLGVANGTDQYAGLNSWPAAGMANNNWQHLVITVDADRHVEFYKNGVQLDRYVADRDAAWNLGWTTISQAIPYVERTSNFIGKGNWPDALYSGLMDDIRIYNHALSSDDIQELFLSAQPFICTERPVMDFNDDCKVDFADLAVLAGGWLECGRIPVEKCDE